MTTPAKTCERCHGRPGGPWNGTGGFGWLCARCKIALTMTPERTARMQREIAAAFRAVQTKETT